MASLSGILKKAFKFAAKVDPISAKIGKITQDIPGSPGALQAAFTSNQPSDPFGKQQGKFDIFAGGSKLSESAHARKIGRAVGTVAALFYGGAALAGAGGAGGGAATAGLDSAAAAGAMGGAGAAAAGTGAAAPAAAGGLFGTGVSTGTAVNAGLGVLSLAEQKKAAKAADDALLQQGAAFDKSLASLRRDTPQTPTIDEARRRAEQADAQRRKRGRRASILTGDTGVGATPISQRTLLGS